MTTYEGSCHCGEITWDVTLQPDQAKQVLCHCNTCKTLSGGAFTLNAMIPKSALKFTKGGDNLKKYTYTGDSGKPVDCYFCPSCTASPYHHQTVLGPDTIILRTMLENAGKEFEVVAEIYGKDKMAWEKEIATTFDVLPPQEEIEKEKI